MSVSRVAGGCLGDSIAPIPVPICNRETVVTRVAKGVTRCIARSVVATKSLSIGLNHKPAVVGDRHYPHTRGRMVVTWRNGFATGALSAYKLWSRSEIRSAGNRYNRGRPSTGSEQAQSKRISPLDDTEKHSGVSK